MLYLRNTNQLQSIGGTIGGVARGPFDVTNRYSASFSTNTASFCEIKSAGVSKFSVTASAETNFTSSTLSVISASVSGSLIDGWNPKAVIYVSSSNGSLNYTTTEYDGQAMTQYVSNGNNILYTISCSFDQPTGSLPYLDNLKLFVWYKDLPVTQSLTSSLSYWQPYYSQSVISASQTVFGTIQNSFPSGSTPISRSSATEGPSFSGSYLRIYSSSLQQYTEFSSLLNDISSSYTIAFVSKLNEAQLPNLYGANGTDEFTLWEKSVQNPIAGAPNYTKGVTYVSGSDNFKLYGGVINNTGSVISYTMDTTASVDILDGNYHLIVLSVSNSVANMYVDNQPLSGSFNVANFNTSGSIFTMGRNLPATPNDILPNLSTLKQFQYFTDLSASTVLSGWDPVNTNIFLSSSWQGYYSGSALSMSVSASYYNAIKFGSSAAAGNYPISRSADDGVYLWGTISDTTASYYVSPNQNITSSTFQAISSSVAFNTDTYPNTGISSSWTVINYIKPDPNNIAGGITTDRAQGMTLWNTKTFIGIGAGDRHMGAALDCNVNGAFNNQAIILYTGISDAQPTTSRIKSGSYVIPNSIDLFDGNYHMIATKFTQIGTGSYASGSVWIDGVHVTGSWVNEAIYNQNEFQWPTGVSDYAFGNVISNQFGSPGSNGTYYRAYLGWVKSWITYGEALSNEDIQTIYQIMQRNSLAPATNVGQESITLSNNFAISDGIKAKAFPGEIKGFAVWDRPFTQSNINLINTLFSNDNLTPANQIWNK